MAFDLEVKIDYAAFQEAISALGDKHFRSAASIGINDTVRQSKKESAKAIAKAGGFKTADVNNRLYVFKANPGHLSAIIRASKKAFPLYVFSARQTSKGVSANAWGKRKLYRKAFITKLKTGHVGVFKRVTKNRLPIDELWGPSVGDVLRGDNVRSNLESFIRVRLAANLKRQIDRRKAALSGRAALSKNAKKGIKFSVR